MICYSPREASLSLAATLFSSAFFCTLYRLKSGLDSQKNEWKQLSEQPVFGVDRSVLHSPHLPQRRARYESDPTRTCVRRKSPRASEMRRMPLRQPFHWIRLPPEFFLFCSFNGSSSSSSSKTKLHARRFQVFFMPVRENKENSQHILVQRWVFDILLN